MEQENRVVVLIDMDCFYCQVEEKLDPELKGKPIAVVQYNPWKGGGIIAVNYVARAMGVTRHMRGDEAKEKCPEIMLPSVPCQRGKADISKYREAGIEVARVLQRFTSLLERASIDEAYLDITAPVQERLKTLSINTVNSTMIPNTYALGYEAIDDFISDIHNCGSDSIEFDYEHARRLLMGAVIVSEIRAAVYDETGYRCSAGIAHNKILAKLVCGMNKPNKQTILPKHSINILYKTLSVKKVKHLGGKFGDTVCELLKISKMGELQKFTEKELQARFDEKNGTWLYNIARGVDLEPVQARFNPKSIGCCKQLRGKSALHDLDSLRKWLKDLGDEIEDRLERDAVDNNRTPKQMVVSFASQGPGGKDCSTSRSYNFVADDDLCGETFSNKALELILDSLEGVKYTGEQEPNRKLKAPIKFLGISVGKFEDHSESKKTRKIVDYFGTGPPNTNKTKEDTKQSANKDKATTKVNGKKNEGKEYILQKYFQAADKNKKPNGNVKEKEVQVKENKEPIIESHKIENKEPMIESNKILESPLDKQESFFARLLNKDNKTNTECIKPITERNIESTTEKNMEPTTAANSTVERTITPVCNVVNCGDDVSNDTDYSGSTINLEINKSIALFEDDPQDIARISSMRHLLNDSTVVQDKSSDDLQSECNSETEEKENKSNVDMATTSEKKQSPMKVETFQCTDCGKTLTIDMFDTHADYHFALKLREEERQRVRDEHKEKMRPKHVVTNEEVKNKKKEELCKNFSVAPIASFFTKLDLSIPTQVCAECGKKVPVEKFPEHLDFHEAQKLNKELNRRPTACIMNFVKGSLSAKRKRKSASPTKQSKLACPSKSIDSFFR